MKTFTRVVTEKHMSINDIEHELFLHTDGDDSKREHMLLATVQELASAIIAIQEELKFKRF